MSRGKQSPKRTLLSCICANIEGARLVPREVDREPIHRNLCRKESYEASFWRRAFCDAGRI